MSWHGGDHIFEPVVQTMIDAKADKELIARVTAVLLEKLIDLNWAQAEESIGLYEHPGVLEGANRIGLFAYGQIPEDGSLSTAEIRCTACKQRVRYRKDEDGVVQSEVHHRWAAVAEHETNDLCPYSNRGPDGY